MSTLLRRSLPGPEYRRDLVSRAGGEVYAYPSPLHAVALQSPLFALPAETPQRDRPPRPPSQCPPGRAGRAPGAGAAQAYIDKLLGLRGPGGTPGGPPSPRAEAGRRPEGLPCSPGRAGVGGGALRRDTGGKSLEQRGPEPLGGPPPPGRLPEGGQRAPQSCVRAGASPGSPQLGGAARAQRAAPTRTSPGPCGRLQRGPDPGPPTRAGGGGWTASSRAPRGARLPPAWGAGPKRRPPQARGAPGRSCSAGSLCPASVRIPPLAPTQALPPGDAPRQSPRRWRSSVELCAHNRPPGAQGPGLGAPRPATRSGECPWPACPGARLGPARSRSGARLAAEGATLAHGTGTHAGGDGHRGRTASRCGDAESSGSDGGSRPARPGAVAPQPPRTPGSPPPRPPVPRPCRIKASKALKRKICRFRPTALKVMTLV